MRFIFVNGRTPRAEAVCACCSRRIEDSYVRELTSRLPFCDADCYDRYFTARMSALQVKPTRLWLRASDG